MVCPGNGSVFQQDEEAVALICWTVQCPGDICLRTRWAAKGIVPVVSPVTEWGECISECPKNDVSIILSILF